MYLFVFVEFQMIFLLINWVQEAEEQVLRKEFEMQGKQMLPKQESEVSDSNAIAPGTEFMFMISKKLQDYISSRISCHPGWSNIKV